MCFGIHGFAPDCGHVLVSEKDEENVFLLAEENCVTQRYCNNKAEGLSGRGKCTAFHRREEFNEKSVMFLEVLMSPAQIY